jgi:two-component system, chemotaxis family, chemotaxis protein CheY
VAKVLVIDDSASVRQTVSKALSRAGFQVIQALDGIEGAKQIRAHDDLAVVVCEINVPRMHGLDMLESVQQEIAEKGLVVAVLTSETNPEVILRGKRAGVKGWFFKPFREGLLVAAVNKLVETR